MDGFEELYQSIILDHNKRPRNFRMIQSCTACADGLNPLCGDEITVSVSIQDGVIVDIGFTGQGCAISKASASLMTVRVKGKKVVDALEDIRLLCNMLTDEATPSDSVLENLGDIAALSGVRQFHARIKCATLGWHTLESALLGRSERTSTESA